ncbi:nitrate- and nitrite sensing domain-containing protein [Nonomuraea sp. NPDC046570]|uniref:sensor histidine kinase n=1 Tax=Nonomuraea sp. NPDC046570 TaxID=3155255 RepID=UPI0033C14FB6
MLLLPLLSLSALWGFVLNLTVGDGQALLRADALYQSIGVTSTELGVQLQAERARSLVAITSRKLTQDLGAQRTRTDEAVDDYRKALVQADDDIGGELRAPIDILDTELRRLDSVRTAIDSGNSTRLSGLNEYNRILDTLFRLYDQLVAVPDLPIFQQASAMQTMGNAREIVAREHALISAVLMDRKMTEAEVAAFTEYVATRKFLHSRGVSALDAALRVPYQKAFDGDTFAEFAQAEARIIASGAPPADAARWGATLDDLSVQLDRLGVSSSKVIAERSASVATTITVRIAVAGGVGLLAVVSSIIISVRFGRRLSAELGRLRSAALELAEVRLPQLVERLRRGEEVDVRAEAPSIKVSGSAEIRDVAHAFASVQRTAVAAAVGQAALRRGVGQVFLNLARRKQGLLHRQLALLDGMQRRTEDPDSLDDLFRLDHLTTRMRRHAEGLIILSGAPPGRAWRKPVAVLDVVRAAIAEVEDYVRVSVQSMPAAALDGAAAADLTHLVAELIENATIYSPPNTTVQVRGDAVSNGYVIEVEDRGLGLTPEEYARFNDLLVNPPEFDLADSDRLGLFVVARLAQRHEAKVLLRASPFGGTTAIILVPRTLLVDKDSLPPTDEEPALPHRRRKPLAIVGGGGRESRQDGTHAGLPRRVRQTNLAPQLKAQPEDPQPEQKTERSPDEVRDLFSAFQRGTQRARAEETMEGDT